MKDDIKKQIIQETIWWIMLSLVFAIGVFFVFDSVEVALIWGVVAFIFSLSKLYLFYISIKDH